MDGDFFTAFEQLQQQEGLQELFIELLFEFEKPWPQGRLLNDLLEISQEIVRAVKESRWAIANLSTAVFVLGKATRQRNGPSMVELAAVIAAGINDRTYAYQLLIAVENELGAFRTPDQDSAMSLRENLIRRPETWSDCPDLRQRVLKKLKTAIAKQ